MKWGITVARIGSRLRVSHFTVRSLRSGRMRPHPKYCWMSSRTSARSPFWLTDRLGLTSHPANKVARGEIETVKHPSPSDVPGDVRPKINVTVPRARVLPQL
jgi:hypothetical protein